MAVSIAALGGLCVRPVTSPMTHPTRALGKGKDTKTRVGTSLAKAPRMRCAKASDLDAVRAPPWPGDAAFATSTL
jgi:hypothetical protein